jgi:hypothetical protein
MAKTDKMMNGMDGREIRKEVIFPRVFHWKYKNNMLISFF